MISKELLSEVLEDDITDIWTKEEDNFIGESFITYFGKKKKRKQINIYELAYKCKEWAYRQGYIIDSRVVIQSRNGEISTFAFVQEHARGNREVYRVTPFGSGNLLEPEGVIKACQWILDNKDNQ